MLLELKSVRVPERAPSPAWPKVLVSWRVIFTVVSSAASALAVSLTLWVIDAAVSLVSSSKFVAFSLYSPLTLYCPLKVTSVALAGTAHAAATAAAKTDNMILFIRLFLLRLLRVSTALLKAPALQALGILCVEVKQP